MYFLRPGVKTTPAIIAALKAIDEYAHGFIIDVSSGLRTPEEQLSIIGKYAAFQGVRFPEYEPGNVLEKVYVADENRDLYRWQRVWSRLLNLGIIINPPLAAEVLEDYIRDGINKKGLLIPGSPHYSGNDFDISGGRGGMHMTEITGILKKAKQGGAPVRYYLVERQNKIGR